MNAVGQMQTQAEAHRIDAKQWEEAQKAEAQAQRAEARQRERKHWMRWP